MYLMRCFLIVLAVAIATAGQVLAQSGAETKKSPVKKIAIKNLLEKKSGGQTGSKKQVKKKLIPLTGRTSKLKATKSKKSKLPDKPPKPPVKRSATNTWQLHSGNDYLEFPAYDRTNYIAGLSDAYNWSYAGGFAKMKWLVECSRGKPMEQLTAMFDKWLKEKPERWDEPAAKLYPFAMFELCLGKADAAKSNKSNK